MLIMLMIIAILVFLTSLCNLTAIYAILFFGLCAITVLTDLELLSKTGFPAPFAILELLSVSIATEICI